MSTWSERYRNEILNTKYGMLTPIKYIGQVPHSKRTLWLCKCDCGKEKIIRSDSLRQGNSKSCGCVSKKIHCIGKNNIAWKGYEEISLSHWNKIQREAKKRNYEFNISIKYVWDLFLKQNKKCALSGVEISFFFDKKNKINRTASLDRIDSSKGYVEGNVQWVHTKVNFMKQALDQNEFIDFCKKISEYSVQK